MIKNILKPLLIILLSITTQTGGLILILALFTSKRWKRTFPFKTTIVFSSLYLFFTFFIIPNIAPLTGREPVKHLHNITPATFMTVLLNRNYIKPVMNEVLHSTSTRLEGSGITINYLDANFPFIDYFPLLPHLSHNDGKKLDLSLIYQDSEGNISPLQKSISGYGIFEKPSKKEYNQTEHCLDNGHAQYNWSKYLSLGQINNKLEFSKKGTKKLIKAILKDKRIGKIFIEPHLKTRLNLHNKRIRFHGCHAVRHDDHIHIQLQ